MCKFTKVLSKKISIFFKISCTDVTNMELFCYLREGGKPCRSILSAQVCKFQISCNDTKTRRLFAYSFVYTMVVSPKAVVIVASVYSSGS